MDKLSNPRDMRQEANRILSENDLSESLGYLFHTKKSIYFYDAGTGRVIRLESEMEKNLFSVLFDESDKKTREEYQREIKLGRYDDILNEIKELDFWKNGNAKELYSVPHTNIEKYLDQRINQLILELTERCNLRCKYCIYNDNCTLNRNFGSRDMTQETASSAIDFLFSHSTEKVSITFYGGEPLLMFPLMKACIEYALQKKQESNKEVSFSFTTNLTLMTEEYAQYFASLPHISILCSLDGPQDIHDAWRQYPDGSGSFEKAMTGFKRLFQAFKEKGKTGLSINGVFAPPYTMERIDRISEFYESLNLPEGSNCEISYPSTGSVDDNSEIQKCLDEFKQSGKRGEFVHPLAAWEDDRIKEQNSIPKERLNHYNLVKSLHSIHERPLFLKASMDKIPFNGCCPPGSRRLYVTTEGNFKVCERIGSSPIIGDIQNGFDIETIKKCFIEDYQKQSISDCQKCVINELCGICYAACFDENGLDMKKKRLVCVAERSRVKDNLKKYYEMLEVNPSEIDKLNKLVTS